MPEDVSRGFVMNAESTEDQRQGGCVQNTMQGMQLSVFMRDRETIEDKDHGTQTSGRQEGHEEC